MKRIKFILFILLAIFSLGCVVYAGVMQCILCYEKYGFIFSRNTIFIPDKSAWWFLGGIGLIPTWLFFEIGE